ncbi:MAG: hypothetical protein JKY42_05445 [Flavobacteriales bacterium]|nr:hypothetical protein [Flavobacteriales bacterium]
MEHKPGTLHAPELPKTIPVNSGWLGGQGLGGWFHLEKMENSPNYRMRRFSPDGKSVCDREFMETSNYDFEINSSFEFTHTSHCAKCRTIQNNKIHTFEYIELINN